LTDGVVSTFTSLDEELTDVALPPNQTTVDVRPLIEQALNAFASIEATFDALDGALRGAWLEVGTSLLGALQDAISLPEGDSILGELLDRLHRYHAIITSIVAARDPDELATTLESLATPVGGWQRKNEDGAFVLSLSAFPGLFGGAEWRWGPYGSVTENGETVYGAAPTVTFPMGLDFARGVRRSTIGFFVSVLDPLAFLQYDLDADGELPGAQLLTVLAPGLAVRFGIPKTPFSLGPMLVYRPAFRTTEAQVAGPGADVIQLGLLLSVDVTLFELFVREGD
jgi:hypothetical protein